MVPISQKYQPVTANTYKTRLLKANVFKTKIIYTVPSNIQPRTEASKSKNVPTITRDSKTENVANVAPRILPVSDVASKIQNLGTVRSNTWTKISDPSKMNPVIGTNPKIHPTPEIHPTIDTRTQFVIGTPEIYPTIDTPVIQSVSSVCSENEDKNVDSNVPRDDKDKQMDSNVPRNDKDKQKDSNVPRNDKDKQKDSNVPRDDKNKKIYSNVPRDNKDKKNVNVDYFNDLNPHKKLKLNSKETFNCKMDIKQSEEKPDNNKGAIQKIDIASTLPLKVPKKYNLRSKTVESLVKSNPLSPLHHAVQNNEKNVVLQLLENGAEVDVPGRIEFETPLFMAAENGNLEILEILSARKSSKWKEGYLPMCIAAYRGHTKIVETLLDKGVDPNANLDKYLTPLHAAAQQGHANIVRLLLDRGANVDPQRNNSKHFISTPLLAACHANHSHIVQLLLENNANFNAQIRAHEDPDPKTTEIIQLNEEHKILNQVLQIGNYKISEIGTGGSLLGYRILHFAVEAQEKGVIKSIISSGASLNAETENGATAIGLAIEKEDERLLKFLLSAGASITIKHKRMSILNMNVLRTNANIAEMIVKYISASQQQESRNVTPIGIAIENGLEICVKRLLTARVNVQIKHDGRHLLHTAVMKKNITIIKLLLDHGVDINCVENSTSSLLIAVKQNSPEIVELLLNRGADLKNKPKIFTDLCDAFIPLHVAVVNKYPEIVELFLKMYNSESNFHKAFRLALQKSTAQIVQMFIRRKISLSVKSERPIFYAIESHNLEVVQFLLKRTRCFKDCTFSGESIFYFALYRSNESLLRCLIDNGVDVNSHREEQPSPLNILLNQKYKSLTKLDQDGKQWLVKTLLKIDANPNEIDKTEGKTLLQLAIENGNVDHLKILLLNGADVNVLNQKKESPLQVAFNRAIKRSSHETWIKKIVDLLVQEVARREAAKEEVIQENRSVVSLEYLRYYYQKCKDEIDVMTVSEIYSGITYLDILVSTANGLANYVRNIYVNQLLYSEKKVSELFPIYAEVLRNRILIGRDRRNLLNSSHYLLKGCLKFDFPLLVVEHIFSFLTNRDLRNLRIAKEM